MSPDTTWRFLQVCMAGGFAVTAINLQTLNNKDDAELKPDLIMNAIHARFSPRPLVSSKSNEPSVKIKYTEPRQVIVEPDALTFSERTDSMNVIADFIKLPMSDVSHDFIAQLAKDEAADPNPIFDKSAIDSVALILDRGVKSFTRDSFTGPEGMSLGFDMIRYEIVQKDDTTSYALAFRRKSSDGAATQKAPVLSMFLVSRDQDQMYLSLYQEGQPPQNRMIQRHDAEENYIPTKVANAGWIRH